MPLLPLQVASQAVATMPSVLLWPLLPFVLEVGLIVYWVAVTAVLYSAGEPSANWRQPAEAYQPLGLQQLMLTNSSMTMPAPAAAPDTTNMTAAVSSCCAPVLVPVCDACAARLLSTTYQVDAYPAAPSIPCVLLPATPVLTAANPGDVCCL